MMSDQTIANHEEDSVEADVESDEADQSVSVDLLGVLLAVVRGDLTNNGVPHTHEAKYGHGDQNVLVLKWQ